MGVFQTILRANLKRVESLNLVEPQLSSKLYSSDARCLMQSESRKLNKNSVDLVLTSPPYPGAQKYVRASSLSLGWLDLCPSSDLNELKRKAIGREEFRKYELEECIETSLSNAKVLSAKLTISTIDCWSKLCNGRF